MPLSEIKTLSSALELFDGVNFDCMTPEEVFVYVLEGAYKSDASDVIFIPGEVATLKYRTQGSLMNVLTLSLVTYNNLLRLIKNLSDLNPNEHLKTQNGKGSTEVGENVVDISVEVIPVAEGEKCILSLSDSKIRKFDLENIGLKKDDLKKVVSCCKQRSGLILIAGEKNSGKTTTAYSLLKYLVSLDRRVATIENPIFYTLLGIDQIESDKYDGTLNKVLEKNPDVVFVDSLETKEAGELISSAITNGLLVISTICVGDTGAILKKLKDLSMNEFILLKSLKLVVFQRLETAECSKCGGKGCRACSKTGTVGSTGNFTLLTSKELT